jgi:hypothetical protein
MAAGNLVLFVAGEVLAAEVGVKMYLNDQHAGSALLVQVMYRNQNARASDNNESDSLCEESV